MNQTITDLEQTVTHCREMLDKLSDAIKMLSDYKPSDYKPDNFAFKFTIKESTVMDIPIGENDGSFCVGVFMAWHAHYFRKVRELTEQIAKQDTSTAEE